MKINKKLFLIFFIFYSLFFLKAAPFTGGFFATKNTFDQDRFDTVNLTSYFLDLKVNDYFKFYTRLTAGLKYYADYVGYNTELTNFSVILNIDLLYLEFKSKHMDEEFFKDSNGYTNYDLFLLRLGRIPVTQGSGFFFNMKGDGLDLFFTLRNFRFRVFGITNSLDFSRFFDFQDSSANPVFTNWDRKRIPALSNLLKEGNNNGFINDIESEDYNFYFDYNLEDDEEDDYAEDEEVRLNRLRYSAILAGRIFTGFSFELFQLFFQNFGLHFLANIDLIPEDFVITYPSKLNSVNNTFGGKYNSFYIDFNAYGKIYRRLYYAVEAVYETGYNTTYYDTGDKIELKDALINSFALFAKLSYFFDHVTKPALHFEFQYAHGDNDAELYNGAIINKEAQDNNYRSPSLPKIGYVLEPYFSNIFVFSLLNTIKPFSFLKNPIFSRFSIESGVLLLMRPVVQGYTIISEKSVYLKNGQYYENSEKTFLGVEIDAALLWKIFSDLSIKVKGGIFIPNYTIYSPSNENNQYEVLWKAGVFLTLSF